MIIIFTPGLHLNLNVHKTFTSLISKVQIILISCTDRQFTNGIHAAIHIYSQFPSMVKNLDYACKVLNKISSSHAPH